MPENVTGAWINIGLAAAVSLHGRVRRRLPSFGSWPLNRRLSSFINNISSTASDTTTMPHQGHQGLHHGNGHGHDSHDGHHGYHGHDYAEDCDEEANETSALLCADVDFSKVSAARHSE